MIVKTDGILFVFSLFLRFDAIFILVKEFCVLFDKDIGLFCIF